MNIQKIENRSRMPCLQRLQFIHLMYKYGFKRRMEVALGPHKGIYILGSFIHGSPPKQYFLTFKSCPCKDKHFLDPRGVLSRYLYEKCQGFVPDGEHRYTINYIVMVLIANWNEKKLIYRYSQLRVKNDGCIDQLLDSIMWASYRQPFYRISEVRGNIAIRHFHLAEEVPNTFTLLYCIRNIKNLLSQIIEQPLINIRNEIYINYCDKNEAQ